jgi:hypothetical protein
MKVLIGLNSRAGQALDPPSEPPDLRTLTSAFSWCWTPC